MLVVTWHFWIRARLAGTPLHPSRIIIAKELASQTVAGRGMLN